MKARKSKIEIFNKVKGNKLSLWRGKKKGKDKVENEMEVNERREN